MIVMVEPRQSVRDGFAALFKREGVPLDGIDPTHFEDWLAARDMGERAQIELMLFGAGTVSQSRVRIARSGTSCPLIAITERHGVEATLRLFGLGVDDVVRVPVHARELLVRANTIRSRRAAPAWAMRFGALHVHGDGRDPEVDGMPLALPRRERRVLDVLARASGRYVTKAQLYSALYGSLRTDIAESVVESHVSKLRRKLRRALGSDPITATRFMGYRIDPPARRCAALDAVA